MINNSNSFTSTVLTSPQSNGPGGNAIVPTPASPGSFPKMLLAIGVISSGLWFISTMFDEQAAKWTAVLALGGIVTYYELHNNHQFSSSLQAVASSVGW